MGGWCAFPPTFLPATHLHQVGLGGSACHQVGVHAHSLEPGCIANLDACGAGHAGGGGESQSRGRRVCEARSEGLREDIERVDLLFF